MPNYEEFVFSKNEEQQTISLNLESILAVCVGISASFFSSTLQLIAHENSNCAVDHRSCMLVQIFELSNWHFSDKRLFQKHRTKFINAGNLPSFSRRGIPLHAWYGVFYKDGSSLDRSFDARHHDEHHQIQHRSIISGVGLSPEPAFLSRSWRLYKLVEDVPDSVLFATGTLFLHLDDLKANRSWIGSTSGPPHWSR